jgi:hypothetical protein
VTWTAGAAVSDRTDDPIRGLYIDPANANRVIASLTYGGMFITSTVTNRGPQAASGVRLNINVAGGRGERSRAYRHGQYLQR